MHDLSHFLARISIQFPNALRHAAPIAGLEQFRELDRKTPLYAHRNRAAVGNRAPIRESMEIGKC